MMKVCAGVRNLVAGAVLVSLAVLLWPPLAEAQDEDPIPGGTYSGTIVDTSGACDEGALTIGEEFSLRLNAHGTRITQIIVNELTFQGSPVGTLSVPVDIAIGEDGAFEQDFEPFGLAFVHVEGQFDGDSVSGSLRVEVAGTVECAGTFTAQGSPPPERSPVTWHGVIEEVDGRCGGGTMLITVSGDQLSVIAVEVQDLNVNGTSVSASATFDEGTVPIAEDGTFGWVYFPGSEAGQEIAVSGRIGLGPMSGLVTVSPSSCGAIPFATVGPMRGVGGPEFLPSTGTGVKADSPGATLLLTMIAGAAGMAALAVGAAVRRRAP